MFKLITSEKMQPLFCSLRLPNHLGLTIFMHCYISRFSVDEVLLSSVLFATEEEERRSKKEADVWASENAVPLVSECCLKIQK